jgi:hypothetical protein
VAQGVRGLGPSGHPNDYEGFLKQWGNHRLPPPAAHPRRTTFRNTSPKTRSVDKPRFPRIGPTENTPLAGGCEGRRIGAKRNKSSASTSKKKGRGC